MSKKNRTFAADYSYCLSAADESATSLRHLHTCRKQESKARAMLYPADAQTIKVQNRKSGRVGRRVLADGTTHPGYVILTTFCYVSYTSRMPSQDIERRLQGRSVQDHLESRKFTNITVSDIATVDVLGMCLYASPFSIHVQSPNT